MTTGKIVGMVAGAVALAFVINAEMKIAAFEAAMGIDSIKGKMATEQSIMSNGAGRNLAALKIASEMSGLTMGYYKARVAVFKGLRGY